MAPVKNEYRMLVSWRATQLEKSILTHEGSLSSYGSSARRTRHANSNDALSIEFGTLYLPARRASRIDPILALRHD